MRPFCYGTSLPVGGKSTHSVITGHRGLPDALLFTRLDELNKGDVFYVKTLGMTLGYRVDSILVVNPDQVISHLRILPGEDRITLMTCTPYGVNTQRLLISGHRAAIPAQVPPPSHAGKDLALLAALVAVLMLLGSVPVFIAQHRSGVTIRGRHLKSLAPRHSRTLSDERPH